LATSINQSFSYGLREAPIVAEAVDVAKREGKSFSKYLVELIKEDLRKKGEDLQDLPIISSPVSRQTTMTEYDIKLFQPSEERARWLAQLPKDKLTKLQVAAVHLKNQCEYARTRSK